MLLEFCSDADFIGATNWYRVPVKVSDVYSVKLYTSDGRMELPLWLIENLVSRIKAILERSE